MPPPVAADALWIAKAETIELGCAVALAAVVNFVCHEDNGKLCAAQNLCHVLVPVGDARLVVDEEKDKVGLVGGHTHLLADGILKDIVRLYYPSAGIDD